MVCAEGPYLFELARTPMRKAHAMSALVRALRDGDDPPSAAQHEWLEACIAGKAPIGHGKRGSTR